MYHKVLSLTINKLLYPFLVCITPHMRFHKSFIGLGSHPRVGANKIKILLVKYIYKKQQIKKMNVIKTNPTIRFTCETNKTKLLVCVVT